MFEEIVTNRITCRSFSDKTVPREYIDILKNAVGLSPSKNNKLPCKVVIPVSYTHLTLPTNREV